MRATEYLFLVVIIGAFAVLTMDFTTDLNEKFPENQINVSNFSGNYNQIDTINTKVNNTFENFQKLGNEDVSWFQKIGAGIVAIPYAVINFPIIIGLAVSTLMSMVTTGLGGIIPAIFILALSTFLLVEIVRRLLEFFQRSRS